MASSPVAAPVEPPALATLATRLGVTRGDPRGAALLPVQPQLAGLLPAGGLRRGSIVRVERSLGLVFALLDRASQTGSWVVAVGMADLGVLAAIEQGVDPARFALVPSPGPQWPLVVAALLDAADIVVLRPPGTVSAADTRRLTSRVRDRGAVLLVLGPWAGAEVVLRSGEFHWYGVGSGYGRLRGARLDVTSTGRGAASRPRHAVVQFGDIPDPPDPRAEATAA